MRDVVSNVGTIRVGVTALPAYTTTQTSPSVDLKDFDGAAVYILAGTWTDGTFTPVVEESDDDSAFTTVADAHLSLFKATSATDFTPVEVGNDQPAAISSAATAINQRVGYIGAKHYIRLKTTVTGSPSTGMTLFAVIVEGRPRIQPSIV